MGNYNIDHYNLLAKFDFNIFNAWRSRNSDVTLNLEGADFSEKNIGSHADKINMGSANFNGAKFNNTTFFNCILKDVDFSYSNISSSRFSQSELHNVKFCGAIMKNVDFSKANIKDCDFSKATIEDVDINCLGSCIFNEAKLSKLRIIGNLTGSKFNNCIGNDISFNVDEKSSHVEFLAAELLNSKFLRGSLKSSKFVKSNFSNCSEEGFAFIDCDFTEINFESSNFKNAVFNKADFSKAVLKNAVIKSGENCIYNEAKLEKTKFFGTISKCKFNNAVGNQVEFSLSTTDETNNSEFLNACLPYSAFKSGKFSNATFTNTNLSNSHFYSTYFSSCKFNGTDLHEITIEKEAEFKFPDFSGALIDRYTLECIPEEKIQKHSRVKMIIDDDIMLLRQQYGGFYRIFNWILIILFLVPYAKFTFFCWLKANYIPKSKDTIPFFEAIFRYVISGGKTWKEMQPEAIPIIIFLITFLYNIIRVLILKKTIDLEHEREIRGLPVKFSLKNTLIENAWSRKWAGFIYTGRFNYIFSWEFWYKVNNYLFYVNGLAVVIHIFNFCTTEINISDPFYRLW